jgi:hypothetical protein
MTQSKQNNSKRKKRLLIIAAILFCLSLVWAELAVGIFGTPISGS